MLQEITTAANFLTHMLTHSTSSGGKEEQFSPEQCHVFREHLTALMRAKYLAHWDVGHALKGNAYRSISNLHCPDPLLQAAATRAGIPASSLPLTREFVLWVDPGNVSYRFGGERGVVVTLYDHRHYGPGGREGKDGEEWRDMVEKRKRQEKRVIEIVHPLTRAVVGVGGSGERMEEKDEGERKPAAAVTQQQRQPQQPPRQQQPQLQQQHQLQSPLTHHLPTPVGKQILVAS